MFAGECQYRYVATEGANSQYFVFEYPTNYKYSVPLWCTLALHYFLLSDCKLSASSVPVEDLQMPVISASGWMPDSSSKWVTGVVAGIWPTGGGGLTNFLCQGEKLHIVAENRLAPPTNLHQSEWQKRHNMSLCWDRADHDQQNAKHKAKKHEKWFFP